MINGEKPLSLDCDRFDCCYTLLLEDFNIAGLSKVNLSRRLMMEVMFEISTGSSLLVGVSLSGEVSNSKDRFRFRFGICRLLKESILPFRFHLSMVFIPLGLPLLRLGIITWIIGSSMSSAFSSSLSKISSQGFNLGLPRPGTLPTSALLIYFRIISVIGAFDLLYNL